MWSRNELDVIEFLCNKRLETETSTNNIDGLNKVLQKISYIRNYDIRFKIPDDMKKNVDEVIMMLDQISDQYVGMGDMSLINEYDKMKKTVGNILGSLGDAYSQLKINASFAEQELKVIQGKVAEELMNSSEKKVSQTMAEKLCRIDDRVIRASEDLRIFQLYTAKVQYKYNMADKLFESLKQSVATARSGMVRESYNQ